MRHIARALSSVIILACCSQTVAAAESTGSNWWPFSRHENTNFSPPPAPTTVGPSTLPTPQTGDTVAPATSSSTDTASQDNWMLNSRKSKISWPRLTKPKMPTTGLFADKKSTEEANKNSWVEKPPTPPQPSPLKKMADGTKDAWRKTLKAITPDDPKDESPNRSRLANRDVQPSFWQRMFGAEQEPQGSQTMPGFIAQQRVDASPSRTR